MPPGLSTSRFLSGEITLLGRLVLPIAFVGAAISFAFWVFLNGFQVDVNMPSLTRLQTSVGHLTWRPDWSPGPWILALAGLLLTIRRLHRSKPAQSPSSILAGSIEQRLGLLTFLTAALVLFRLLILWKPTGLLLPFLTVLWGPHIDWAVAMMYLLFSFWSRAGEAAAPVDGNAELPSSSGSRTRHLALLLFGGSLLLFAGYALYYCQVTMLHGDEPQYLRVTQSLIRDGDIDLSNNLDRKTTDEFHVAKFDVHKAPSSPAGKVHSGHPVGLSVLLIPAYAVGLELWQNPRLSSALFMSLLAASCVTGLFIWLTLLGVRAGTAAISAGVSAVTVPLFTYSNQLYPEIPALFLGLLALIVLSHWQHTGIYHSLGRWEAPFLGGLVLLLGGLPFLHPRFAPVAGFLGLLATLQAWKGERRAVSLICIALSTTVVVSGLVSHNFAFNDTWLGHFASGAAWGDQALSITYWPESLPRQWLDQQMGLLVGSPIMLLALSVGSPWRERAIGDFGLPSSCMRPRHWFRDSMKIGGWGTVIRVAS